MDEFAQLPRSQLHNNMLVVTVSCGNFFNFNTPLWLWMFSLLTIWCFIVDSDICMLCLLYCVQQVVFSVSQLFTSLCLMHFFIFHITTFLVAQITNKSCSHFEQIASHSHTRSHAMVVTYYARCWPDHWVQLGVQGSILGPLLFTIYMPNSRLSCGCFLTDGICCNCLNYFISFYILLLLWILF